MMTTIPAAPNHAKPSSLVEAALLLGVNPRDVAAYADWHAGAAPQTAVLAASERRPSRALRAALAAA